MSRWNQVCERCYGPTGYSLLSADEKLWINVRSLIDATANGGLISYFYNSNADTIDDCRAALDELGAREVRAQLDRIAHLFGDTVPRTVEARNAVIDSWEDENDQRKNLLDEVDSKLFELFPSLEAELDRFLHRAGLAP